MSTYVNDSVSERPCLEDENTGVFEYTDVISSNKYMRNNKYIIGISIMWQQGCDRASAVGREESGRVSRESHLCLIISNLLMCVVLCACRKTGEQKERETAQCCVCTHTCAKY